MPPRGSQGEYHNHKILAKVIEEVLRTQTGSLRVPQLANSAGFSRFHLARIFHESTGETLEHFLRRIRLERAAYALLHADPKIFRLALDCGYQSPEAFSRAFRQAFGCLPTDAKTQLENWELGAESDLHWNAEMVLESQAVVLNEHQVKLPARTVCVLRVVGNYAQIADSWCALSLLHLNAAPAKRSYVTLYRDNLWTHPVCRTLRADIGWVCSPNDVVPRGMRKLNLPAGLYVKTRPVEWEDRTAAWCQMWGRYLSPSRDHPDWTAYDEYSTLPIPFAEAKTRIIVSLK